LAKDDMNDDDEELLTIRAKKLEEMKKKFFDNPKLLGDHMPSEPITVTEQNFEEVIAKNPLVVIDCWAPWCGPCRMVAPVIEELAKDYEGKILFGKLNTDENQGIAMKYNIMSIPTFLIFKNGELIDRPVGAMPKPALEEAINQHLK
jgi:thioredoxin 1